MELPQALSYIKSYLVSKWHPGPYRKEIRYRDDLLNLLKQLIEKKQSIKGIIFSSAIREAREGCDIRSTIKVPSLFEYLTYDICIELKYNFNNRNKLDKLIGQLDRYKQKYAGILLVFVGKDTKEDLLIELKHRAKNILGSYIPIDYVVIRGKTSHIRRSKSRQKSQRKKAKETRKRSNIKSRTKRRTKRRRK